MAFIGLGIGLIMGTAINIALIMCVRSISTLWHALTQSRSDTHRRHPGAEPPPEARLITGEVGAVFVPVSLYFLAFTSYRSVPWIVPVIASSLFGIGFMLCFSSTFTYLVSGYRPMAASAMAANAFVRSAFAAAFPLFAGQMYNKLGTDGATALLAGIMTVTAPLP